MKPASDCQDTAPQSVLLITDDSAFRSHLLKLWQAESTPPLIIWVPGDMAPIGEIAWCDIVVLGPVCPENLGQAIQSADAAQAAVAVLPWGVSLQQVQLDNPNVISIHESEAAFELAVSIGKSLLRHVELGKQLAQARSAAREVNRNAALGRFMLENRHSFNNALTSVLGTSELLLLLEPSEFAEEQREHVRTMYTMAMRMQQLVISFTALESELKLAEFGSLPWSGLDGLGSRPASGARP